MKVELKTCRAGVGFVQNIGDVIDVDVAEGERLLAAGQAKLVEEPEVESAATEPDPEAESAATEPGVENASATPKPKRKRSTKKPAPADSSEEK